MIRFACPHCQAPIAVPDESAGKRGKCKHCNATIEVPYPAPVVATPAPAVSAIHVAPNDFADRPQNAYAGPNAHASPPAASGESKAVHSLGIASMVLGILSFFTCWVPFAGLIFSGIGLLLGLSGLAMSIARKGAGIGYGIAGTAVCAVGLGMGATFMLFVSGMIAAVGEASEEIAARQARPPVQATPAEPQVEPDAAVASNQDDSSGDSSSSSANGPATGDETIAPEPSAPESNEPPWHDAQQPLELGEITLRIKKAFVGLVPLRSDYDNDQEVSRERQLAIVVEVKNNSQRKKIDFRSWSSDFASLSGIGMELTDDFDNRYKPISFTSSHVSGTEKSASLYPGKTVSAGLIFEPPVDGSEFLRLKLSGEAVGEEGEFRFQIPASMIGDGYYDR